jgi:hypothetical protein
VRQNESEGPDMPHVSRADLHQPGTIYEIISMLKFVKNSDEQYLSFSSLFFFFISILIQISILALKFRILFVDSFLFYWVPSHYTVICSQPDIKQLSVYA